MTEISFGNELEIIWEKAFSGCNIKRLDFPPNLKYIGDGSFSFCTQLEFIEFPEGLEYIGSMAFIGCDNLREITIPQSITQIGDNAFISCKSLKIIRIPEHFREQFYYIGKAKVIYYD